MRAIDERTSPPLARFGAIHRAAVWAEWAAARATGLDLRIEDDGETLLGAAPGATTTMLDRAFGFDEHPAASIWGYGPDPDVAALWRAMAPTGPPTPIGSTSSAHLAGAGLPLIGERVVVRVSDLG